MVITSVFYAITAKIGAWKGTHCGTYKSTKKNAKLQVHFAKSAEFLQNCHESGRIWRDNPEKHQI